MDNDQKEFENFFPIVAVGERVTNFEVGDFIALIPERKFGIVPDMSGDSDDEYMMITEYDIDYKVTKEYAEKSKTWKPKASVKRYDSRDLNKPTIN